MSIGSWVAVGIGIGVALFVATGGVYWIAIGAGIGVAIGVGVDKSQRKP